MKRWILIATAVFALSAAAASTASAQGFGGIGYGCGAPYGGIGYSAGYAPGVSIYAGGGYGAGLSMSGYGGYGGYGPGLGYGYGGGGFYPQPHLDYHPATVRRHWGHLDVVPGHYHPHSGPHY